eukprot:2058100-Pyramimonas_sp.AAC.1
MGWSTRTMALSSTPACGLCAWAGRGPCFFPRGSFFDDASSFPALLLGRAGHGEGAAPCARPQRAEPAGKRLRRR